MNANLYALLAAGFPPTGAGRPSCCPAAARSPTARWSRARPTWRPCWRPRACSPATASPCQAPKTPEAVMLYLATLKVGAVFLPLNTAYTPSRGRLLPRRRRAAPCSSPTPWRWRAEAAGLKPRTAIHAARAGRPGRDDLHQRHHRPVQGRDAEPRQPGGQRAGPAPASGASSRATCCCTPCRSSTCTACSWPCTRSFLSGAPMLWLRAVRRGRRCWPPCPAPR